MNLKKKIDKNDLSEMNKINKKMKRKLADYLNKKSADFTQTNNKVLLIIICILFSFSSIYLILNVIF